MYIHLIDLFYEFCFNEYVFSVIIIDTRRDHRVTDMGQVVMEVAAVVVVVIRPRILHQVISEVVVMQEMVTPMIGGRTKITGGTTIEDHRHQMPTPSASFFLGCDTILKSFCV